MLLIPCPNCGKRDQTEFDYGGRAVDFPELNAPAADWHQVIHLRENPRAVIEEFWYHAGGCECWFKLNRDLVTHAIDASTSTTGESNS